MATSLGCAAGPATSPVALLLVTSDDVSDALRLLQGQADPSARDQLGLAKVLVVVAGDPWQKQGLVSAPAEDRFAMVAAAIDGADRLEASRSEIDRAGPTYTVDTVEQLRDNDAQSPDLDIVEAGGLEVAGAADPAFKALFGGLVTNPSGVTEEELGRSLREVVDDELGGSDAVTVKP